MKSTNKTRARTSRSLNRVVGPLEACIRLERLLRHHPEVYHICLDYPEPYGLGQWLKRVIRDAKRPNNQVSGGGAAGSPTANADAPRRPLD